MYSFLLFVLIASPEFKGNVVEGGSVKKSIIIGGKDTDISKAPHMVSILYGNKLICGGSIINEYTILTAAHCLYILSGPDGLSIRCGSSFHNKGGRVHSAERIKVHEKYNGNCGADYDVGIIRVKEPIEFDENAKPIPLPEKTPETGETVRISGWGRTSNVSWDSSEHLKSAEVDIFDWKECKKLYCVSITPRMICASRPGIDSCSGDSGGGMEYKGKIVGIVSFGNGCANPRYPGVYANVADPEILEFIKQNLN